MGVRFPSVATTTIVNALPASGAETVILTTPPLNLALDFEQIFIFWYCTLFLGTGTATLLTSLRRGTTVAGALLTSGLSPLTVTAGNNEMVSGCFIDTPGAVAGQQYSLTMAQNIATVAGTLRDVCMIAFAL